MTRPHLTIEVISALMKGPKTINELCDYYHLNPRNAAPLRRIVHRLHDAGILRIAEYVRNSVGKISVVWAMQTELFELPDAVRPLTAAQLGETLGVTASAIYAKRFRASRRKETV